MEIDTNTTQKSEIETDLQYFEPGAFLRVLEKEEVYIFGAAFNCTNEAVAIYSSDNTIRVHDVSSLSLARKINAGN
jgi:hypothetical protein